MKFFFLGSYGHPNSITTNPSASYPIHDDSLALTHHMEYEYLVPFVTNFHIHRSLLHRWILLVGLFTFLDHISHLIVVILHTCHMFHMFNIDIFQSLFLHMLILGLFHIHGFIHSLVTIIHVHMPNSLTSTDRGPFIITLIT